MDTSPQIEPRSLAVQSAHSVGNEADAAGSSAARRSELALVIGFLLVITAVPVAQTCLELARRERVQFTDVFRYRPTSKNLRQFETTLKEKSWFQQQVRPKVQRLFFDALRDTGSKAIAGQDDWLFYRPDVRWLVEPNRVEAGNPESRWVPPPSHLTRRDAVAKAIGRFRDQLKERGIALVVLPVPGKPSVYPDQVTSREHGKALDFQSPTLDLIRALQLQGIETVNLFDRFREVRAANNVSGLNGPLYLAQDTHWTPRGAQCAAQAVAERLRELGLAPPNAHAFQSREMTVWRWGDVLEMMQIPGLRGNFALEPVRCVQVVDPLLGPLLPTGSERPGTYRYPGQKASILVLGDSFCRIYQYPEPQSLGETVATPPTAILPAPGSAAASAGPAAAPSQGSKRLLPGSAGFVSQLMLALGTPVDAIYSDGGASTDVRRKLSTNPEILEGKKVVLWEFVERDIALGQEGWEDVPLPPKME